MKEISLTEKNRDMASLFLKTEILTKGILKTITSMEKDFTNGSMDRSMMVIFDRV
jgi:hypothetical protein